MKKPAPSAAGAERYDLTETQARRVLALLIVFTTAAFSYLAYRKYAGFKTDAGDLTVFGFAFSKTIAGKFFPFFASEGTIMGNHPNFMLWLAVPFFWMVPAVATLLVFQSLLINLATIPAYLLARDKTGSRITGLIAAVGLLAYPTIASQHVNQIHDDQFGLALLLFAFYFFEKENFKKFALCMAGSLLAKETICLTTGMFGIWALLRRRNWKWVAFPIGWSVFYLVVVLKGFMAAWQGSGTLLYTNVAYFEGYGKTPGEVLTTMLTHPAKVLGTFLKPDRLQYMFDLLKPVAVVLPFGALAFMMALPTLFLNVISTNSAMRVIPWHYGSILGGMLFMSLITSLPAWQRWLTAWFGQRDYARWLCIATVLLSVWSAGNWFHAHEYEWTPVRPARLAAVRSIPNDASVFSPDNMLAHFIHHPKIHTIGGLRFWKRDINELFDYDYIVFDNNFRGYDWQMQAQLQDFIRVHKDYQQVFSQDGVWVYHRTGAPERVIRQQ